MPAALQELGDITQKLFGIRCDVECGDPVAIQDTAMATHAFRIAQEAVNNAARHSGAKRVTIRLTQQYDTVTLTVVDDGKGLPEKLARATGMGLSIMAHRAQMIGGTFQIDRGQNGGTRVACAFKIV